MQPEIPAQSLPVFEAEAFTVAQGANFGDVLSVAMDLSLDDIYALSPDAKPRTIAIQSLANGQLTIAEGSPLGGIGHRIAIDCSLTLMPPGGQVTEALVLAEIAEDDALEAVYILPLAALEARQGYVLVGIDTENARTKLAERACARFTRGTHITLASGEQRQIEDLAVGDRVLTRDNGPQVLRWIDQMTVRAVGDFAPIRISAGVLNNENDLIVSPEHRLFIYQREDALGAGRSELMVRARHLENGTSVRRIEGGFVDYFTLLFDAHFIIYAEGIAAESMLIDTYTAPSLPDKVAEKMGSNTQGARELNELDVKESLLKRPDAAEILRRASTR